MFGLFKKKKKEEEFDENTMFSNVISKFRKYLEENNDASIMLIANTGKSGYCFIQGHGEAIFDSINRGAKSDDNLMAILRRVVNEYDDDLPISKRSMDIINDAKKQNPGNIEEVNLPGVGKVLSIDPSKIDDMSDEEVDMIIKNLMDQHKNNNDESKG